MLIGKCELKDFKIILDKQQGKDYICNMETKPIYIIEMPGKEPREVTNIKFDVVEKLVYAAGGKIYPKPLLKVNPPIPLEKKPIEPSLKFFSDMPIKNSTENVYYSWSDILTIARVIKEKHFSDCPKVMSCRIELNRRMRSRLLGRAWSGRNMIELSFRLMNVSSQYLQQVIYHEFLHIKFPGQGHTGMEFRYYERHNPYRNNKGKTNRLSCVG